jgi:hypothetical protein
LAVGVGDGLGKAPPSPLPPLPHADSTTSSATNAPLLDRGPAHIVSQDAQQTLILRDLAVVGPHMREYWVRLKSRAGDNRRECER